MFQEELQLGFWRSARDYKFFKYLLLRSDLRSEAFVFTLLASQFNDLASAKFLSDTEKKDLLALRRADMGQTASAQELHMSDVKDAAQDWKVYAFCVCHFCTNTMLYSFSIFLPTIIRQIGTWSVAEVQVLTIPVYILGAVTYIIMGRLSDLTQKRGIFTIGGCATCVVGYCLLIPNYSTAMGFTGCFIISAGCYTAIGTPLAWLTSNYPRYGKRAFASGLQLSTGTVGGIVAPFLFSTQNGPTYYSGYGAMIGLMVLALTLFIVLQAFWRRQNVRRLNGEEDWKLEGKSQEEIDEMGDRSPRFIAMTWPIDHLRHDEDCCCLQSRGELWLRWYWLALGMMCQYSKSNILGLCSLKLLLRSTTSRSLCIDSKRITHDIHHLPLYVAAHDFGPKSCDHKCETTVVQYVVKVSEFERIVQRGSSFFS